MDSSSPTRPKQGPKLSIIPARALDDPRLTSADIALLALLGTYANSKSNICWVSDETLATRRRVDVSVIRKSMARLKRYGYIARKKRRQNTALTTILFDDAKTRHPVPGLNDVEQAKTRHPVPAKTSQILPIKTRHPVPGRTTQENDSRERESETRTVGSSFPTSVSESQRAVARTRAREALLPDSALPDKWKPSPELNALASERGHDPATIEAKFRSVVAEYRLRSPNWTERYRRFILDERPPKAAKPKRRSRYYDSVSCMWIDGDVYDEKPDDSPSEECRRWRRGQQRLGYWRAECERGAINWDQVVSRLDMTNDDLRTALGNDETERAMAERFAQTIADLSGDHVEAIRRRAGLPKGELPPWCTL